MGRSAGDDFSCWSCAFQQQGQGGAGQQQTSRHKRPSADAAGFRQVVAGSVSHRNRCCSTACGAGHLAHCAVKVIAVGGLHLDIPVLAFGKPCPSQGAISIGLDHRLQVPFVPFRPRTSGLASW